MSHETQSQFVDRKRRERSGSVEADRTGSASELFQIDRLRTQRGSSTQTGDSIRQLYGRLQLDAAQQQAADQGGGGLFSSFGAFARKLTEPLIDLPDLPGPLNLVEEGLEELSSPIGLAAAVLFPVTGGTSLGLTGIGGLAARGASIAAAEVLVGGVAVGAASAVNDNLPENTPTVLRLIANIGAGAAAGGATSIGFRRAFANQEVPAIIASIKGSDAARELGQMVNESPKFIQQNVVAASEFRGEQFKNLSDALVEPFSEGSLRQARAGMRGSAARPGDELLSASGVAHQFTPLKIQDLYADMDKVYRSGAIDEKQVLGAQGGLVKLLNGILPQQNEWDDMAEVWGTGLKRSIDIANRSTGGRALDLVMDLANTPRALAASSDMSAPLRQGIMLIGHPKEFAESYGVMVKSFFNSEYSDAVQDSLIKGPRGRALKAAGVEITDYRPGGLNKHEEQFISQLIHNVPGLGKLTRASERAYTVFLNKLRADVYDNTRKAWEASGTPSLGGLRRTGGAAPTPEDFADLAKFVNFATGRSNAKILQGPSGRVMSAAFFSPQFLFSRLQAPRLLLTATPAVRRQVARDMGIFIGTGIGVLSLLKMSGVADVEIDPRSADFGKGRVGNTRFDFWGGYQQIVRYTTQAIVNERKSTATGEITGLNRAETVGRFFQSKLAPPPGLGVDVLRGETIIGDELDPDIDTLTEQMIARTMPFFFNDVKESFVRSGLLVGAATVPLSFFGVGANSYSSTNDLIEQYGLSGAEPHERLAILAQNPELADELVRRREISAERGSEAAQRGLDAEQIREQFTVRQESADSLMLTGQMTAGQWRDQRKVISNAERNQIQTLFRDVEPGPETPLSRFFAAIEDATDEVGQVDWDAVDLWKERQPQADQDFVDRNTGLRDTDLERAYKETLSGLDDVGYFDITDNVWSQLAPRAGLTQFATYRDWRRATLNQLAQLFTQQGIAPELAMQEAERRLATHQVQKAYGNGVNALQRQFVVQNPALARQAAQWELFSTTIEERQFLSR